MKRKGLLRDASESFNGGRMRGLPILDCTDLNQQKFGLSATALCWPAVFAVTIVLLAGQFLVAIPHAWAWGKRGHATVASVAALVAGRDESNKWLKVHTFDFAYYSNVPDILWKEPSNFAVEKTEHYLDLDVVRRQMDPALREKPWPEQREEFERLNPKVEASAGRVLWRIAELDKKLGEISTELRRNDLEREKRQQLQGQWLVQAGILGHYIADLAQPLHTTENYDGQKSGQVGLHRFFESDLVDELYPRLDDFVYEETKKTWPRLSKELAKLSTFALAKRLAEDSFRLVPRVLETDKKVGRESLARAVRANKTLLIRRLALGSMYLAEVWRRHLGWKYDGHRFYYFSPQPVPISVGSEPAAVKAKEAEDEP